ncbi:MAG: ROK family protein, partial [Bacilli bacterium]
MRKFLVLTIEVQHIDLAIIQENGQIITYHKLAHQKQIDLETIKELIVPEIKKYQQKYPLAGVAISTGGQVDSNKGEILYASDLISGYSGFPIKSFIEQQTNLIVEVQNDVNCSALAETWMGSAKTANSLFYLSIGVGVGGGFVLDNKLVSGHSFGAGEVGYLPIKDTTLEEAGSIQSIINKLNELKPQSKSWTFTQFLDSYLKNDEICITIMDEFIDVIVISVVAIAYMMNPQVIALGGELKGHH